MTDDSYEVIIARYGARQTVRSDVYLNYALYHEEDGPIGLDYFVWVIRNAVRTILVDTGFSTPGGERRKRTMLTHPTEIWDALGITPESAPPIVLTHAHFDHAGNLDHFPDSQIIAAQAELDFWAGPQAHRELFHHSVEDDELQLLRTAQEEGRVTTFRGSHRVAPGVDLLELGGHTPGQSVVRVQTSDGIVVLASDAVHFYEELDRGMPFMSVADLVEMYDAFDRLNAMVADGTVTHLVSGHDPSTLGRFEPLGKPLVGEAAVIGRLNVGNAEVAS
jgi:glyoxylase-like metal-dependent hydrolase (beta-lactamase superfamily II)